LPVCSSHWHTKTSGSQWESLPGEEEEPYHYLAWQSREQEKKRKEKERRREKRMEREKRKGRERKREEWV